MHVVYSFPHAIGRSGIGTTALHQVEGLARQGVRVTLFCTSVEVPVDPRVRVVTTLSRGSLRVPHRALGVHRAYRWHDRVVATLLPRLRPVDLVHTWPAGCLRTLAAARRLEIPSAREVPNTHTAHAYVTVARELAAIGLAAPKGHSHTASTAELAREEREYAAADVLLVPSEYSRQTFVDRGFAADRLVMHQYGFDPASFPEPSDGSGSADRADGIRAVFLGRLEPRKGLHHALRAWVDSGAADRGQLVVCGRFIEGYADLLRPLLDHPSVQVRDFDPDPGALLRDSDLLLLPSLEEGSALVTYEAQACGCALAVSDAAGARCTDGVDALVHRAGDVDTLTAQLRRLDQEPDLLAGLRRAALAHRAELSWDHAAVELASAYEQAIGAHRATARTP